MRAADILPDQANHAVFDGLVIRKGTVAAFLANARTWLRADASTDERAQAQAQIAEDLPALGALGLFELLEIRDARLRAFVDAHRC